MLSLSTCSLGLGSHIDFSFYCVLLLRFLEFSCIDFLFSCPGFLHRFSLPLPLHLCLYFSLLTLHYSGFSGTCFHHSTSLEISLECLGSFLSFWNTLEFSPFFLFYCTTFYSLDFLCYLPATLSFLWRKYLFLGSFSLQTLTGISRFSLSSRSWVFSRLSAFDLFPRFSLPSLSFLHFHTLFHCFTILFLFSWEVAATGYSSPASLLVFCRCFSFRFTYCTVLHFFLRFTPTGISTFLSFHRFLILWVSVLPRLLSAAASFLDFSLPAATTCI